MITSVDNLDILASASLLLGSEAIVLASKIVKSDSKYHFWSQGSSYLSRGFCTLLSIVLVHLEVARFLHPYYQFELNRLLQSNPNSVRL